MTSRKIISSSVRPLACLIVKPAQFSSFTQTITTTTTLRHLSHHNDFCKYYKRTAELPSSRSLESLAIVKSYLIHRNSTSGIISRNYSQLTSVSTTPPPALSVSSHKKHNNMTMKKRAFTNNENNLSSSSVLSYSTNTKSKKDDEQKENQEKTEESSSTTSPSSSASATDGSSPPPPPTISRKEQLKKAVKDYGATVIVFHVTMSLCSLGFFYLLVSSGLDVVALLEYLGVGQSILESKLTQGSTTFVVAYAVHKVFAPVRITITLTAVPFIVRYLRKVGILKKALK